MQEEKEERLRVLIANQPARPLALVRQLVEALGHEVFPPPVEGHDIAALLAEISPDVALVTIGHGSEPALTLIEQIVFEGACPVIALIDSPEPECLLEASKRGIFAYVVHGDDAQEMQSSIDIVLRRFAEYHDLEGAFGRRAVTERAKGILMERHGIDEQAAFDLLRDEARRTNRKLVDLANAVVSSRSMLPVRPASRADEPRETLEP